MDKDIGNFGVYAVDPQIFSKCNRLQVPFFWSKFGWQHGYLVEAIPDQTRYGRLVRENLDKGQYSSVGRNLISSSLSYLYERTEELQQDTLIDDILAPNQSLWEQEVIARNKKRPYNAVFTAPDSTLNDSDMNIIQLQEYIEPRLLATYFPSGRLYPMKWQRLMSMLYPWFNKSTDIKIIDPYFNPYDQKQFHPFLDEVMNSLLNNLQLHDSSHHLTVEFHCAFSPKKLYSVNVTDVFSFRQYIYDGFEEYMKQKGIWSNLINFTNYSFKFIIWDKSPNNTNPSIQSNQSNQNGFIHDRFIIVDEGGRFKNNRICKVAIQFTGGLGEIQSNNGIRTIAFLPEPFASIIDGKYKDSSNVPHVMFEYVDGNRQAHFL
ncbi:MAG: hypothetical protein IJQ31_04395 [Thermoguttaceae bacterium]|nr:hypothetical protein [Thermoguttaceae bacterium]